VVLHYDHSITSLPIYQIIISSYINIFSLFQEKIQCSGILMADTHKNKKKLEQQQNGSHCITFVLLCFLCFVPQKKYYYAQACFKTKNI
jgi:hypothetical protein